MPSLEPEPSKIEEPARPPEGTVAKSMTPPSRQENAPAEPLADASRGEDTHTNQNS
jgi:hypothetical protein